MVSHLSLVGVLFPTLAITINYELILVKKPSQLQIIYRCRLVEEEEKKKGRRQKIGPDSAFVVSRHGRRSPLVSSRRQLDIKAARTRDGSSVSLNSLAIEPVTFDTPINAPGFRGSEQLSGATASPSSLRQADYAVVPPPPPHCHSNCHSRHFSVTASVKGRRGDKKSDTSDKSVALISCVGGNLITLIRC